MAAETQNRAQLAASHWKPRFIANGIDVNDFERVLAAMTGWNEWAPAWRDVGDAHHALGDAAVRGDNISSS